MEIELNNLVTIITYAKMCEITYAAARKRIKTGAVKTVNIDGIEFIDIVINPPKPRTHRGRHR